MEGGYDFVKGKSWSKWLALPDDTPRPSRVKINAELRQKRISALEEDIANLDQQIGFKEKRRQQSENVRNYKLCQEITHEIGIVKQQRHQLSEELNQYREKERKAKWYQRSKRKAQKRRRSGSSAGTATSDEGEFPLPSPSTSEVVTRDSIEIESEDDTESVCDRQQWRIGSSLRPPCEQSAGCIGRPSDPLAIIARNFTKASMFQCISSDISCCSCEHISLSDFATNLPKYCAMATTCLMCPHHCWVLPKRLLKMALFNCPKHSGQHFLMLLIIAIVPSVACYSCLW